MKGQHAVRASSRCNDKGFHSLMRASYLFLIGQENVTEKKATPDRRLPDILSSRCVLGSRWSLIAHPCASIDRPHPCGLTACIRGHRSPPLRGPDESSAHRAREQQREVRAARSSPDEVQRNPGQSAASRCIAAFEHPRLTSFAVQSRCTSSGLRTAEFRRTSTERATAR